MASLCLGLGDGAATATAYAVELKSDWLLRKKANRLNDNRKTNSTTDFSSKSKIQTSASS